MIYTANGYEGFTFSNLENTRVGPLGEVVDCQIVEAPKDLESEIGCWLSIPTRIITKVLN